VGIGDQQNDPVVDRILKRRPSSEVQTDAGGSRRAAANDPATAAKRARPAPAAEVNPRLVARRVAYSTTRQTVNLPIAVGVLDDANEVSIGPPVAVVERDGVQFVPKDLALLDEANCAWIRIVAAPT
jgi:hypothetical protein